MKGKGKKGGIKGGREGKKRERERRYSKIGRAKEKEREEN